MIDFSAFATSTGYLHVYVVALALLVIGDAWVDSQEIKRLKSRVSELEDDDD